MTANICRTLAVCGLAAGLALIAAPASAQSGQMRGKVLDADNKPVEGATIKFENIENGRSLEGRTNKKGEYIQVGLALGSYKITVTKGPLTTSKAVKIGFDMLQQDFTLTAATAAGGTPMSKEEVAKARARADSMTKTFNDGVELSNADKADEAIAKFNEVLAIEPKCPECYANIGTVQVRQKKYDEAEASYKKAIEIKPDSADAYNGLANVYNAEKKFDQAAEAAKKAMDLSNAAAAAAPPGAPGSPAPQAGNASNAFNQGVILWNAGKIPEAKAQFEQAVKLDPLLADAHYWLGMALVNGGNTAEAKPHFETYLKLAPTGQYVETAKAIVASIK
jgi:tetratricopeptide (TPR) repeat protein